MGVQRVENLPLRKSFSKIGRIIDLPNLIDVQKNSYRKFLQREVPPEKRENVGLQAVFKSVFPIWDFNETSSLQFVQYILDRPKYDEDECRQRDMTYAAPVKVVIRLEVYDKDEQTGEKSIRDIKEQEVYFGDIPLMTDKGTFIVNGTERTVVSQLHRSPGVFFDHDSGKTHTSGKVLFAARIIPYRGSWLDFEFDARDRVFVRIDRRRKLLATVLLRAMGYSTEELLNYYYQTEVIRFEKGNKYLKSINYERLPDTRAVRDVLDPETGRVLVPKNRKFTQRAINRLKELKLEYLPVGKDEILGRVAAHDVIDEETGEILMECNEELNEEKLELLRKRGVHQLEVLYIDGLNVGPWLRNTLLEDKINSPEEALLEIYSRMRPGDPPTLEAAQKLFDNLFFNPERYDLSRVGRLKFNYKFSLDEPLDKTVLTKKDILETVRYLLELRDGRGSVDDIDHLGNRRVRSVGELLENQYRVGLVRMERAIKERMTLSEIETMMPYDLVNPKPVTAVVKEFFGSSQLSQFLDQTNPLSEITHKRRLSALGPGGLTRERAGFEVRDVHNTHYGRICPIETPEGPNIGLISSLSSYARVNEFGFVETPYQAVRNRVLTGEVRYYTAMEEENHTIAQANTPVDEKGRLVGDQISARRKGEFVVVSPDEVDLMDVSPNQLVSVAAALVPFLEHDDANRALMGSNMQRQAVPLLRTEAPLVGTGLEQVVARDSGVCVVAQRDGVVDSVEASRIVVRATASSDVNLGREVDIYNLVKFRRSNQNTCLNQKPIVKKGDRVKAGDILADGPATCGGELALGRNVTVAFMPWGGYNFEDSILISERVVKDDSFTSLHIEELECTARDTKLGREEITRDIPNVSEESLKNLDESGIVRIGAEVTPGDILVGKITPKGETQLSPEEKLLRAIFGEKAADVKDTSLRVPPGIAGTVIGVRVFSRKGVDKDERTREIEDSEEAKLLKDQNDEVKIIGDSARSKIRQLLLGQKAKSKITDSSGKTLIAKGKEFTDEIIRALPDTVWPDLLTENEKVNEKLEKVVENYNEQIELVKVVFGEKINRLKRGDDLPAGVIKQVKVFLAMKRKLSVGDKMAGRHGNKGVISRILPEEDMPYLPDGTPVDIVLNPLGVPSRMNVGQVLEVHLGWAARELGRKIQKMLEDGAGADAVRAYLKKIYADKSLNEFFDRLSNADVYLLAQKMRQGLPVATPVFDGAKEKEIRALLKEAGLPQSGQTILFDGRTGEAFRNQVTVGTMYMLKLHHLVDDKIHARSIGPYSLVTQQPLGGKAQFGGQRLGEMEVWAMEAYGAAYTLQEFVTVKSDDVAGRTRTYESIVKGEHILEPGIPEAFNVLLKELQALALDVELIEDESQAVASA
jgi:DNA-directed RNA polymerase subunit beta